VATNASVLIPQFKYYARTFTIADGDNDEIGFKEDSAGSVLTATVAAGTYVYGELAYQVKKALEAAGDSTYTVRYDYSAREFTLTSDGSGGAGDFELDVASAGLDDLLPALGFAADQTGALTYTGSAVPSQTTMTFTKELRFPRVRRRPDRDTLELENGRNEVTLFGSSETITAFVEDETPAVAQAYYDLVTEAAEHGAVVEFYPDSTSADYAEVQFLGDDFSPEEQIGEGLYRHYRISFNLRISPTNAGTLTARDFLDRRPSS